MNVSGAVLQRGEAIAKRLNPKGWFVEVGTLHGHLAYTVREAFPKAMITMVDNWLPMDQQPKHYIETKDDHALHNAARALRNETAARNVASNIGAFVMKSDSVEAARNFQQHSVDMVFIDADHSYEGCKQDIQAWKSKVKVGGWLGGHDYRNPDPRFGGVDKAVDEAFPDGVERGENFTWWVQL